MKLSTKSGSLSEVGNPAPQSTHDFRGWPTTINIRGSLTLREALRNGSDIALWLKRVVRHVWRHRRYFTLPKLLNMALVTLQHRCKTEFVLGRPFQVAIEPTNVCASRCALCPTGRRLPQGRDKGMLPLEEYELLLARYICVR